MTANVSTEIDEVITQNEFADCLANSCVQNACLSHFIHLVRRRQLKNAKMFVTEFLQKKFVFVI